MSILNKINGIFRSNSNSFSKINGVYRINNNGYSKLNGVWRSTSNNSINSKDIVGFKLIYRINKSRIHHDNKRLSYNENIPYKFKLTGDISNKMTLNWKGVIFEFSNNNPEEEGIIIYEGRLYASLVDGRDINICQISGNNKENINEDEFISEFYNIYEVGELRNLDIKLEGYVLFEDYGYYFAGWNNLFNTKPFIDKTIYPDKTLYRKQLQLDVYNILPVPNRDKYFDSVATIGIARDMETPIYNMNGAHGVLDHTINKIILNGKDMPFVIEIK